jgi:hypothetical protein
VPRGNARSPEMSDSTGGGGDERDIFSVLQRFLLTVHARARVGSMHVNHFDSRSHPSRAEASRDNCPPRHYDLSRFNCRRLNRVIVDRPINHPITDDRSMIGTLTDFFVRRWIRLIPSSALPPPLSLSLSVFYTHIANHPRVCYQRSICIGN